MRAPVTVVYLDHTAKWSGGEIALQRTLEALDRSRVNPIVVLAEDGPFRERLAAAGIEVHVLPLSERVREVRKDSLGVGAIVGHLGTAIALLQYAGKVGRFARSRQAAILHCNSLKSDFYGALAGRLSRIPVIWHVRDHIDPTYLPGPVVKIFRAFAKSVPAYIITNSASTTEKLFPSGPGRQRVRAVFDGLAGRELTSPEPEIRTTFRHTPPRVGLIGRIVPWKGQHVLMEAAALLTGRGVEARYVVVGAPLFGAKEKAYEADLHIQAGKSGDRVEFLGFQSNVPEILRGLDIMVHTSTSPEPFGQVVIEGMAEGLPVIASDGGGVQEIIADKSIGMLTPMGDARALADALEALLSDPVRANVLARAGWQTVRTRFTAAQSARGVEDVYDDLLGLSRSGTVEDYATARDGEPDKTSGSRSSDAGSGRTAGTSPSPQRNA